MRSDGGAVLLSVAEARRIRAPCDRRYALASETALNNYVSNGHHFYKLRLGRFSA